MFIYLYVKHRQLISSFVKFQNLCVTYQDLLHKIQANDFTFKTKGLIKVIFLFIMFLPKQGQSLTVDNKLEHYIYYDITKGN